MVAGDNVGHAWEILRDLGPLANTPTGRPVPRATDPAAATVNDPGHDVAAATSWFDQWSVYRTIVDHDWMHHGAIAAAVRSCLGDRGRPVAVLDLGCGDAEPALRALAGVAVADYTGVDASAAALAEARRRLAAAPFPWRLVTADVIAFLDAAGAPAAAEPPADVILAGFVAHHFPAAVKERFFAACRRRLAPGGELFYADVHRLPGTSREEYLAAYIDGMRTWTALTPDGFASACHHVRDRDFPETEAFTLAAAAAAGFSVERSLVFADAPGFHRLYRFSA
jgi:SAM-dependent methyltransferase